MKHSKEPWFVNSFDTISNSEDQLMDCCGTSTTSDEDTANAARIVSCVNACAGIENPEDLRKQRDELVAFIEAQSIRLKDSGFSIESELFDDILSRCKGDV